MRLDKKSLIEYISINYNSIATISLSFSDGETEELSLIHSQIRSRERESVRGTTHTSVPQYPTYRTQPPLTRSTSIMQETVNKLLRLIKIESTSNSRITMGNDINHVVSMIALSRQQIFSLESMNNMFNYMLRQKCKHSLNNTYHPHCQVCSSFIYLLNLYPDSQYYWRNIIASLEDEFGYPTRVIVHNEQNYEHWKLSKGINSISVVTNVDKTDISNSIRVGQFIHALYERSGYLVSFSTTTNQLVRLIPANFEQMYNVCSEITRQLMNTTNQTTNLLNMTQQNFVDVSINFS